MSSLCYEQADASGPGALFGTLKRLNQTQFRYVRVLCAHGDDALEMMPKNLGRLPWDTRLRLRLRLPLGSTKTCIWRQEHRVNTRTRTRTRTRTHENLYLEV